jgi:serine protease Do
MTIRHFVCAALLVVSASLSAAQQLSVLRISVTVVDAENRARPVPRHALLISDNPATAAPRRVVTSAEGAAEMRLRPGSYTIESDQALVFQGKAYEWRQTVNVEPGKDAVLELTAANAQVESSSAGSTMAAGESSPSELLMQWQDTVVSIWSPTARGSAFLIDPRGLLLTNQRIIGTAASVEVQLTLARKVSARVLAADRTRNVAVLWVDPSMVSSLKPVKLAPEGKADVAEDQSVFAIDAFAIEQKTLASGRVSRVDPHTIASDLRIDDNSSGAPMLAATGDVIGIMRPDDASSSRSYAVRIDDARPVIAEAQKAMAAAPPASAALLPVEAQKPFPQEALEEAAKRHASSFGAYELHGADFDVSFITPGMVYAARRQPERTTGAKTAGGRQDIMEIENARRALQDFGNWSGYVADTLPVLLIRATPKLVENFWTTVGRTAAQTQGMSIPPIKHVKSSFSRMRLYCGETEVQPIHPFTIERKVDDNNSISEGLYVYDPASVGSQCSKVTLSLFSDKQPDKADTRTVDPRILEQIATDFAPFFARR